MSSLTSLGVNKNKKGFAPKIKKRKDRNSNGQKLASTSTHSTAPIATHNVTSTSTILPTPIAPATTMATLPPPPLPIQKESPKYPSLDPKTPPPVNALSPSLSNMKKEPLTEEEMAINASGPARRRRRRPSTSPPPPPAAITAQLSVPSTYGNTLSAPSPVTSPSPNNAPSPVAPVIERPDCAFEAHARSPALKIERVTPDARSKLFDPSPVPSSDNDIGYGDLMDSDDADDKHSLDDVGIDFDTATTTAAASSQQQPRRRRETTAETSEDEEVNVITVAPRRSQQQTAEQPSSQTEEPDEQQSQREETVEPPVEANDDDSDYQESSNSPAKKRKTASKAKTVKKKAAAKKGKKTDKAKKTTPASTEPEAQNAEASSSSKRNKRKATAISVGIGIPIVANASSSNNNTRESSVASEPTDDDDNDRNKKKKKKRGRGGLDRTDFRFVENMRTLDDVTGDPAKVEYLDQPMSNFTRDIDGVVSKTFKEMETQRQAALQKELDKKLMSPEELEELRKKEAEEEQEAAKRKELAEKAKEEERRRREAERDVLTESSNAVQVRIVNGEIVLDTDTLVVERRQATEEFDGEPREIVEENSMSRKVNSQSYSKRKQSSRWDALETELFYECLSQFGTDFEMISQVLPGRTRGQVRTKFNREERLNPMKVTDYLIKKRKPLDIEKYKEMAGVELEAVPEDFHEMQLA